VMIEYRKPIAILAEGRFGVLESKTAACVLRYRASEVSAVIDSATAGRRCSEVIGVAAEVPIVSTVTEAAERGAGTLLIGVAPQGGRLPETWKPILLEAVERGWDLVSGLHTFFSDDEELVKRASRSGSRIVDLRKPPPSLTVASGRAATTRARIVCTVGTDCDVGKMTASYEIVREARRRGLRVSFVATGQTGIFLSEWGVAVDAVPADFVAGATEAMVLEAAEKSDLVVVEGQGSLVHPGYSGVTLGLLHGCLPDGIILCHEAGRKSIKDMDVEIPPLAEMISLYEGVCRPIKPTVVTAVALNCFSLSDSETTKLLRRTEEELGIPAADCIKQGAGVLLDSFLARFPVTAAK